MAIGKKTYWIHVDLYTRKEVRIDSFVGKPFNRNILQLKISFWFYEKSGYATFLNTNNKENKSNVLFLSSFLSVVLSMKTIRGSQPAFPKNYIHVVTIF